MACYHPLKGYKSRRGDGIVFNHRYGWKDWPLEVACGQCRGCRLEQRRQWTMRIMHEASLHEDNCFVTLTFDDAHLPADRSLSRYRMPAFMRMLRDNERYRRRKLKLEPAVIRYYGVGEYGSNGRPHYHLCLFGHDPADKSFLTTQRGHKVYLAESIAKAWENRGMHQVGTLTEESARYVAGYVQKKVRRDPRRSTVDVVDSDSGEVFAVAPEFSQMSRRPGIGRGWIERYYDEVVAGAEVIHQGRPTRAPAYYDRILGEVDPEGLEEIKRERRSHRRRADETPERLAVREKVAAAREAIHSRRPLEC